jgi:hypothetical protein
MSLEKPNESAGLKAQSFALSILIDVWIFFPEFSRPLNFPKAKNCFTQRLVMWYLNKKLDVLLSSVLR